MARPSPVTVAVASQRWAARRHTGRRRRWSVVVCTAIPWTVAKQTVSVSVNMAFFTFAAGWVSAQKMGNTDRVIKIWREKDSSGRTSASHSSPRTGLQGNASLSPKPKLWSWLPKTGTYDGE